MAATEITFPDSGPDRVSREVERPAEYVKELGKYRGADGTGRARCVGTRVVRCRDRALSSIVPFELTDGERALTAWFALSVYRCRGCRHPSWRSPGC